MRVQWTHISRDFDTSGLTIQATNVLVPSNLHTKSGKIRPNIVISNHLAIQANFYCELLAVRKTAINLE